MASLTEADQVIIIQCKVRSVFQVLDVMDFLRFPDPSVPLADLAHVSVPLQDLLALMFPLPGFIKFYSFFCHGKKKTATDFRDGFVLR